MITGALSILGLLLIVGAIFWGYTRFNSKGGVISYKGGLLWPILLAIFGVVWIIFISTGSAQVAATDIAVVENTVTGEFSHIGPGLHIFPMQPKLVPFVTKTTHYTLRRQIVEVGEPSDKENYISMASISPMILRWIQRLSSELEIRLL